MELSGGGIVIWEKLKQFFSVYLPTPTTTRITEGMSQKFFIMHEIACIWRSGS